MRPLALMKSRCCGPKLHGITQKRVSTAAQSPRPLVISGIHPPGVFDITDAWDVTGAIDWTWETVNAMKLVVEINSDGKKTALNTIWLVVAYALP